jgi:hypothetical protein
MLTIGCDYHPSFQQIAFVDTESGELKEQRLAHREGAEEFYRALAATGLRSLRYRHNRYGDDWKDEEYPVFLDCRPATMAEQGFGSSVQAGIVRAV